MCFFLNIKPWLPKFSGTQKSPCPLNSDFLIPKEFFPDVHTVRRCDVFRNLYIFSVYEIYYAPRILGFTFLIQLVDALITPLMTRMVIDVFGEDFNVYQYISIGSIGMAVVASLAAFLINRK